MRPPLSRFTLQRWMVVVAALALTLALVREGSPLSLAFFLVLLGFPVLTTGNRGMTLTLRTDTLSAGYCYFAGVVGPAVCLVFDRTAFRSIFVFTTMLGPIRLFDYTFVGAEMALLTLWLWSGKDFSQWSGLIAGALRVGAIFLACFGLVLLSSGVPRWTILMRALGFIQLLAAFAYYIQGGLAARLSGQKLMTRHIVAAQFMGAALAVLFPFLVQIAGIYL